MFQTYKHLFLAFSTSCAYLFSSHRDFLNHLLSVWNGCIDKTNLMLNLLWEHEKIVVECISRRIRSRFASLSTITKLYNLGQFILLFWTLNFFNYKMRVIAVFSPWVVRIHVMPFKLSLAQCLTWRINTCLVIINLDFIVIWV